MARCSASARWLLCCSTEAGSFEDPENVVTGANDTDDSEVAHAQDVGACCVVDVAKRAGTADGEAGCADDTTGSGDDVITSTADTSEVEACALNTAEASGNVRVTEGAAGANVAVERLDDSVDESKGNAV